MTRKIKRPRDAGTSPGQREKTNNLLKTITHSWLARKLLAVFIITTAFPIFAKAEVVQIYPIKDTYISSRRINNSYGSSDRLSDEDGRRGRKEILLQFNLSQIPEGAEIISAKLKLYANGRRGTNNTTLTYAVLGNWDESTTWNSRSPRSSNYEDSVPITATGQYYEWDLTGLVRDWVDGIKTNYGIYVIANRGRIDFNSREAGSNPPILAIEYERSGASGEIEGPKVIEYGFDMPDTEFLKNNITEMEKAPFDGVVIEALDGNYPLYYSVFSSEYMNLNDFLDDISNLQTTNFQKFTDNFLLVDVVPGDVDWFDDWSSIIENIKIAAQVAKEGGLKGFFLDVETYQFPLFSYPDQKNINSKSFEDYKNQAKLRGEQFIEAINSVYPDITIFLAYGYTLLLREYYSSLPDSEYGLLSGFLDGILKNCNPFTIVVDGYEISYPFKNEEEFLEGYYQIKDDALTLTDVPEKYETQLKAGFGIWLDYYSRYYGWSDTNLSKNYFTPEEFKNAVTYALKYSESYVWIYSEYLNWWDGSLPDDYIKALESGQAQSQQ